MPQSSIRRSLMPNRAPIAYWGADCDAPFVGGVQMFGLSRVLPS